MNTSPLNGTVIGNGSTDSRVFVSITALAQATTSATVYAIRYMSSSVTAAASGVVTSRMIQQATAAITAAATSTIDTGLYYAKYVSSSITAAASGALSAFINRFAAGSTSAGASHTDNFIYGTKAAGGTLAYCIAVAREVVHKFASGAAAGSATGVVNAVKADALPAQAERVMKVASEDRKMKVS